jgi:hypothetical protein
MTCFFAAIFFASVAMTCFFAGSVEMLPFVVAPVEAACLGGVACVAVAMSCFG